MEKKISFFVIAALVMALSLFAAPAISHAVAVNTVNVAIGPNNFSLAGWNLPITLNPNQTLVLGQLNAFNFDTSDALCTGSANCPLPVVTVNGQSFTDTTNVLHLKNGDPGGFNFNEAQKYTLLGISSDGTFDVSVGYADNLHLDACGSGAASVGLTPEPNCLPSPFDGSGGTTAASVFRLDDASAPAGFPTGPADGIHCTRPGASGTTCWDTGLIEIHARGVPEPSTPFLLGIGLVTVLAYGWRWKKRVG